MLSMAAMTSSRAATKLYPTLLVTPVVPVAPVVPVTRVVPVVPTLETKLVQTVARAKAIVSMTTKAMA
ncbi:MAG: hypothetical protein ACJATW_000141 [Glaciecola sp.]|jgi:hypothetical protein